MNSLFVVLILAASGATGFAQTLDVPDGTAGLAPVNVTISQSSPYTVPSGRNFYLATINSNGSSLCGVGWSPNMLRFCHLRATGATNLLQAGDFHAGCPHILGPGTVVDSTSSAVAFDLFGFTVPAKVQVVLEDIPPSGTYRVPAGQNLYLTRLGYANAAQSLSKVLRIGSQHRDLATHNVPLVIGAGQTIRNDGDAMATINGYLLPQ